MHKVRMPLLLFLNYTNRICPGYITYVQYLPDYNFALALQVNEDSSHNNFSLKKYFNTIKKVVLINNEPTSGKRG